MMQKQEAIDLLLRYDPRAVEVMPGVYRTSAFKTPLLFVFTPRSVVVGDTQEKSDIETNLSYSHLTSYLAGLFQTRRTIR